MSMVVSLGEDPGLQPVPGYAFSTSRKRGRRATLAAGLLGSLALFPLAAVQGVRRRSRHTAGLSWAQARCCAYSPSAILPFPAFVSRAAMRRFAPQPRVHWHA